jgi:2-methylisocitrate lyase-like PEP mutase family enzyme
MCFTQRGHHFARPLRRHDCLDAILGDELLASPLADRRFRFDSTEEAPLPTRVPGAPLIVTDVSGASGKDGIARTLQRLLRDEPDELVPHAVTFPHTPGVSSAKAERLRELHAGPGLLVLPNAWDVASARVFVGSGFPAIATASWAIAATHGYPDGENIPREEMLAAVERIARSVDVPVSADLEAGYGDPVGTAGLAWDAGAVGMNFEDKLRPPQEHAADVRAIKEAVPELVLNARTDVFLRGSEVPDEAITRANAYLEAGADCAYVIGVADLDVIGRLAREINGPINVLVEAESPPLEELERLGVRRVTFGPNFFSAGLARVEELARALRPG